MEHALMDVADVMAANILIRFSDAPVMKASAVDSKLLSGARNFEMGLAFAVDMFVHDTMLIVVDGPQNIFDRLPGVRHVKDVGALMDLLAGMKF